MPLETKKAAAELPQSKDFPVNNGTAEPIESQVPFGASTA
jgi:hypothetical protein